jgi:hypothetical protein
MYLLIVGAPRSGTTLLASMIGMHSDVAMLIEDRWFSIKKLTGKKVLANKLCIPIQLDFTKRATYFTRLMKKLGWYQNYPASKYNMEDYLQLEGLKIIALIRDKDDVVNSIMKRGRKEKMIAEKRWKMAMQIMHRLNTSTPKRPSPSPTRIWLASREVAKKTFRFYRNRFSTADAGRVQA